MILIRKQRLAHLSLCRLTGHECVICQEPIRGVEIKVPCGHYFDKKCILDLFDACTRDESLFPPRCCQKAVPPKLVQTLMRTAAFALFNEKAREFGTSNRVYCSNPRCSHFLGPQSEGRGSRQFLRCPIDGCGTITCAKCKTHAISRSKHVCKADDQDQPVLDLGEREGWVRCPGCTQLIELNLGCYHMTCRCKTQFCYLCRALWKTCSCPQWIETNLLTTGRQRARANVRANAQARGDERLYRVHFCISFLVIIFLV